MIITILLGACGRKQDAANELRVLAWVGYEEPEFLRPIEEKLGAKVTVKTYVGGDQMYSFFQSAPAGTYDVVVVDAEYGRKLFRERLLVPLEKSLWQSADLFRPFDSGQPVADGENVYAAVVRWGALGLVYNRNKLTESQASD
jgi:spermidine/putrescine-binding protein